jgi:DnaJ-class molecular chaperone
MNMNFRLFSDNEVMQSIRERQDREEINNKIGGEAYLKCKNCNGTGLKYRRWGPNLEDTTWSGEFCDVCGGTGYVDWVEAVIKGTGMVL